ncbi:unnamed protein product [Penicillium palitans]
MAVLPDMMAFNEPEPSSQDNHVNQLNNQRPGSGSSSIATTSRDCNATITFCWYPGRTQTMIPWIP